MADAWTAQHAALQASDLGAWLVDSAPQGEDLMLLRRRSMRGDPFAHATRATSATSPRLALASSIPGLPDRKRV
jgi:hypothetical protein